jgi:long-chain acyl-CoA synthetase
VPSLSRQTQLGLTAAPVRRAVRISLERELLDPSLARWDRTFRRRARGLAGAIRGRSRDRLDAAGEAFFAEALKPRLLWAGVERVHRARRAGSLVIVESTGSEHVVRPLARHLAADRFVARRLEFRDGIATGRVLPGTVEAETRHRPRPAPTVLVPGDASVRELDVPGALAGRNVLLIGATGFIGKVWLAALLEAVPDVGRVHLLLRRRGRRPPEERVTRLLAESPVFESLRCRLGPHARELVGQRLPVLEGDVRQPGLGLGTGARRELAGSLDLVVNCAGLTEFNPDPRDALAVNVDGVVHLLDFVEGSRRAALLHVSTCFVAGRREGRIPETVDPFRPPSGEAGFHPEEERRRLHELIEERGARVRAGGRLARSVRRPVIGAVVDRARDLGWPNIYTFTKALGEGLIALRTRANRELAAAIVRPSIVESAVSFPCRGWNEGVNTSAPLSYLLGSSFRQLPVNQRKRLDVVPVDAVARGLTLVAAALVERRHDLVVQLATSAVNPLDLRRAVELTSLAHQKHHRSRPGWRSRVLERLEAVPVSRQRYGRLSVPAQLRAVRALNRALSPLAGGRRPLARAERVLQRVKELIDLYEPFLLDNEPVFEADHVQRLAAMLPPHDRERFGYDVRSLDWYSYWIDVHMPGLRRWSYPLIEGRSVSAAPPAGPVPAPASAPTAVPARRR